MTKGHLAWELRGWFSPEGAVHGALVGAGGGGEKLSTFQQDLDAEGD